MEDRTIRLVALGAILIGTCYGAPLITDEVLARKFVDKTSPHLYSLYDQTAYAIFNIGDDNPWNMVIKYEEIFATAKDLAVIVNQTKAFHYSHFENKELRHIFDKIKKSAGEAVLDKRERVKMLQDKILLEELAIDKDIKSYHEKTLKLSYFPEIHNIFAKSNDTEELKYYWSAWRDKNSAWAKIHFGNTVDILRKAAKLNDMTPHDFWMREYNMTEIERVMTQIEPLYKQLHAFIRKQLFKKYGDQEVKPNGPIPDHLFHQVLAQAWTDGSVIDEMYPHKDLPPYDSILEKNNYDTLKLYKTADKFYQSLGFDPIPESIWDTQIRMNKEEDKGDCKTTVLDLTSNVYMDYCQKMDFRKFLQAHGYMGRMYYAREKKDLPAYYFASHDLEYPIGEAAVLSASTPKHLKAIGMVTDFKFTDEVLMNRLLRMLNKHYWKLMDKYVGVEPPVDRDTNYYDFPFKFYIDLNENTQAMKFNTEVLGYQFYKKFCEISGQYPSEPLQNCDFYDNTAVGDAIKKMMKLGSSKDFHEVLAALLPENPSANAESLLEYYQPIKTWLTDKNRDANVQIGWTLTDKHIV